MECVSADANESKKLNRDLLKEIDEVTSFQTPMNHLHMTKTTQIWGLLRCKICMDGCLMEDRCDYSPNKLELIVDR